MANELIDERLTEIFRDVFDDGNLILTRDMSAKDIEDWDSLAQITLLVAIEKEFDIKLNLAEVRALENVGDMMDLIQQKIRS